MSNYPGRVRINLAKRLLEVGILVDPTDLIVNRDRQYDVARWNGEGAKLLVPLKEAGIRVDLFCWDRMSDCAKNGCVLGERDIGMYEIHVRGAAQ